MRSLGAKRQKKRPRLPRAALCGRALASSRYYEFFNIFEFLRRRGMPGLSRRRWTRDTREGAFINSFVTRKYHDFSFLCRIECGAMSARNAPRRLREDGRAMQRAFASYEKSVIYIYMCNLYEFSYIYMTVLHIFIYARRLSLKISRSWRGPSFSPFFLSPSILMPSPPVRAPKISEVLQRREVCHGRMWILRKVFEVDCAEVAGHLVLYIRRAFA